MKRAWLLLSLLGACSPTILVGEDALSEASRSCGSAEAYHRDQSPQAPNHCLHWTSRLLSWHLDAAVSRNTQAADAISRGFAHWPAAAGSCTDLQFVRAEDVAHGTVANDGVNTVLFRQSSCVATVPPGDPCWRDASCGDEYDCWDHPPATEAITTLTFKATTGEVLDGDIEFDLSNFLFTTVDAPACPAGAPAPTCVAQDLEAAATHEVGHFLGLAHTPGVGPSVMVPTQDPGSLALRTIDDSSACFVCDTYPAGHTTRDCR